MTKFILIIAMLVPAISGCAGRTSGDYSRTDLLMGTFVDIKVRNVSLFAKELEEKVNAVLAEARVLEKKLSAFDTESELNQLNLRRSMSVSDELFDVLESSVKVSRSTEGAFDVTIAPVLKAKGFYSDMPEEILRNIPDIKEGVSWRDILIEEEGKKITLGEGVWIDLSGIAVGYIVDRMAGSFEKSGITSYLINAGGDIRCGKRSDGAKWMIGLQKPGVSGIALTLGLYGESVTTSGDYENFIVDKGGDTVVSHIVDPATSKAIEKKLSSVSVIAPDCVRADAFATGMMVLGSDKGIPLAEKLGGIFVIFAENSGGDIILKYSKGAESFIARR